MALPRRAGCERGTSENEVTLTVPKSPMLGRSDRRHYESDLGHASKCLNVARGRSPGGQIKVNTEH